MTKITLKERWFYVARWFCRIFCLLFFRIRVFGKENVPATGPLLLVSNHQSFLDPLFCGIFLKRKLSFLARDSLFRIPVLGKLIFSVDAIPVRRGKADLSAIKTVIKKLKAGEGVCLFPEATRTRDGKIASLKPGFSLLCRRGKATVVPTVIDGAFECWPRHKKIFTPGKLITIRYGKALSAEEISGMDNRELAAKLTETLRAMQNDSRAQAGKEPIEY